MSYSKITVVNRKRGEPYDVYIGRGTPFGNPASLSEGNDRNEALRKFEDHLSFKVRTDPSFVAELRGLVGKKLGCSCSPLPCHGHIIEAWVEQDYRKQLREKVELPNLDGLDLESRARELATWAHGYDDQRRKWTNEPYIVHPGNVVRMLREMGAPEEVLAAAWLHDCLEDTILQKDDVLKSCGQGVLTRVEFLTDTYNRSHGNREMRVLLRNAKLSVADTWTQNIKLCDRIDNLKGISLSGDKKFSDLYWKEGVSMVETFTDASKVLKTAILQKKFNQSFSMEMG